MYKECNEKLREQNAPGIYSTLLSELDEFFIIRINNNNR